MSTVPLQDIEAVYTPELEPWTAFTSLLNSVDGLQLAIRWITLFSCSDVTVPPTIFAQLGSALQDREVLPEARMNLATALLRSASGKVVQRQDLINVITTTLEQLLSLAQHLAGNGDHL
jgi:hypothetical protein